MFTPEVQKGYLALSELLERVCVNNSQSNYKNSQLKDGDRGDLAESELFTVSNLPHRQLFLEN